MTYNKISECPKCGYDLDGRALGGHIAQCDGTHPEEKQSTVDKLKEKGLSKTEIAEETEMTERAVERRM